MNIRVKHISPSEVSRTSTFANVFYFLILHKQLSECAMFHYVNPYHFRIIWISSNQSSKSLRNSTLHYKKMFFYLKISAYTCPHPTPTLLPAHKYQLCLDAHFHKL